MDDPVEFQAFDGAAQRPLVGEIHFTEPEFGSVTMLQLVQSGPA
jgi:hypothetical protein